MSTATLNTSMTAPTPASLQQERRQQENFPLSILVDLGVTYRRTLGDRVAQAFFSSNDIAADVANRIMHSDCQRRATDWELHVRRLAALRAYPRDTCLDEYHSP